MQTAQHVAIPPLPAGGTQTRASSAEPMFAVPAGVRTFLRSWSAVIGLVMLLILIVLAVAAPLVAPHDPTALEGPPLAGPSAHYLLGTDELGRDILSRLIYGTRSALLVAVFASAVSALVGVPLGLFSGYLRGWIDASIMRVIDVLLALPSIVLALVVAAVLGPSLPMLILAIAIASVPAFARLTRSSTLAERESEYVQAAKSMGAGNLYVMFRSILPNILGPIIVQMTVTSSLAIVTAASLSFLGVALPPPTPTWGGMLQTSVSYLQDAPTYGLFPGLFLFCAIAAFDGVGRGFQAVFGGTAGRSTLQRMPR